MSPRGSRPRESGYVRSLVQPSLPVAPVREGLPGFPPQEGVGLRVLFQDFGSLPRELSQQDHFRFVLNFGEPINRNRHFDGHGALDYQATGSPAGSGRLSVIALNAGVVQVFHHRQDNFVQGHPKLV